MVRDQYSSDDAGVVMSRVDVLIRWPFSHGHIDRKGYLARRTGSVRCTERRGQMVKPSLFRLMMADFSLEPLTTYSFPSRTVLHNVDSSHLQPGINIQRPSARLKRFVILLFFILFSFIGAVQLAFKGCPGSTRAFLLSIIAATEARRSIPISSISGHSS